MLYRVYFAHPLHLYEVLIITNSHAVDEERKHGYNLSKATWLFTSRSRTEHHVCKNQTRTVPSHVCVLGVASSDARQDISRSGAGW